MCLLEFSNLFCLGPPGFINLTSFSLHVLSKLDISYYSVLLLTLYTVLGKSFGNLTLWKILPKNALRILTLAI